MMDFLNALRFSHYAMAALGAHPDEVERLAATIDAPFAWSDEESAIDRVAAGDDGAALASALRRLRRLLFVHTIARDLSGRADWREVCIAVTRLAELAIRAAVMLHHRRLAATHGEPRGQHGVAQQLVVVGMGKLGGGELNVSSDVDLIFLYPEDGDTDGARPLSNREFFERLGRRVISALSEVTADGFIFRVDMRLRPYGESGPLAVPFSALEQYLITQGRAWERYAWLKARPLTGGAHDELIGLIRPFVYRKYLDFDAYDGLRDIHRQIRQQGRRRDYARNIKLGPGGIREIEFTVQALQLVRGGREPALQIAGSMPALAALEARALLPEAAVLALREAYVFLRNCEHRLQYRDDAQTQTLPADPAEYNALAQAMGFDSSPALTIALDNHRAEVSAHFEAVFGNSEGNRATSDPPSEHDERPAGSERFSALWRDELGDDGAEALAQAGFGDPAALLATLTRVRASSRYLHLPALSQQRFDVLLPRLLTAAAAEGRSGADAQTVFMRLLALLETVSRRSAYLALVIEHPPLLPRLAQLMGASGWAAEYLTRHPILLDELLDARVLLSDPDINDWRQELSRLLGEHAGDTERQMDGLRHFQHAQTFRLLAQDLAGTLTVERLSDHLSALADLIIAATVEEVWKQMRGGQGPSTRFAVIGYGKLGGKELGYASDLDLVFLYDDADEESVERYTRLAHRTITWLTSTTAAGRLYDTDLRLRPDGAAGLVVSSFRGFRRYQSEQAWTWEHQALTRARFVAGDPALGAAFEEERTRILRMRRDIDALRIDIADMRRKMFAGHPNPTAMFDLKHDPGGMVDVEFAVQLLVLAHAHQHASLTRNAGNIALLGMAHALRLLPASVAESATVAYRHYRRRQHQLRLTGAPHARVTAGPESVHRAAVDALWMAVFGVSWRVIG